MKTLLLIFVCLSSLNLLYCQVDTLKSNSRSKIHPVIGTENHNDLEGLIFNGLEFTDESRFRTDISRVNDLLATYFTESEIDFGLIQYGREHYKNRRSKKVVRFDYFAIIDIDEMKAYIGRAKTITKKGIVYYSRVRFKKRKYEEIVQVFNLASSNNFANLDYVELNSNCGPVDETTGKQECVTISDSGPICISIYFNKKFRSVCSLNNNYMTKRFPDIYPDKEKWKVVQDLLYSLIYF